MAGFEGKRRCSAQRSKYFRLTKYRTQVLMSTLSWQNSLNMYTVWNGLMLTQPGAGRYLSGVSLFLPAGFIRTSPAILSMHSTCIFLRCVHTHNNTHFDPGWQGKKCYFFESPWLNHKLAFVKLFCYLLSPSFTGSANPSPCTVEDRGQTRWMRVCVDSRHPCTPPTRPAAHPPLL